MSDISFTFTITVRNSRCGKVMFLHLSISHSVHTGYLCAKVMYIERDACMSGENVWQELRPLITADGTNPTSVFAKCTRMAIMSILASEDLLRENKKIQ